MRFLLLALVAALLAAGCVTKGDAFPAGTTAAAAAGSDESASTALDAAGEGEAPPADQEAEAPDGGAEPSSDEGEVPAEAPAAANESVEPEEPAPAQPQPWSLNATFALGWAQAVAAPDGTEVHGATAEGYCPDAGFVVPAGATALAVRVDGAAANEAGPGAGVLVIDLTHPDGTVTSLSPVSPDASVMAKEFATADPAAAAWSLHARAVGPAANQAYVVSVVVDGESVGVPALEVEAPACS